MIRGSDTFLSMPPEQLPEPLPREVGDGCGSVKVAGDWDDIAIWSNGKTNQRSNLLRRGAEVDVETMNVLFDRITGRVCHISNVWKH
jgi:hypothetical protein